MTAQDEEKIDNIFFQHYGSQCARLKKESLKFVYYTTAEVALSIIKERKIWMRNASTMNDFSEVEYGLGCVREALASNVGEDFFNSLNNLFPSLEGMPSFKDEFNQLFDNKEKEFTLDTFLTCFSEHLEDENENGRLSMWRAYGGKNGVALVFHAEPIFMLSKAFPVYPSPVAYLNKNQTKEELNKITQALKLESNFLKTLDRAYVMNKVFNTFRFASLCIKHPGFKEEREWRTIASPLLEPSNFLEEYIEIVRGVPQVVLKIKLEDNHDKGINGLALHQFLDKIIIGPTEFPMQLYRAFGKLLTDEGHSNIVQKIQLSKIPLRHIS